MTGGVDDWVGQHMPAFPFGATVGEFSGESQRPPESLRVGRRCVLASHDIDGSGVWDDVAQCWVHYLDQPRRDEEEVDQIVARIMQLWVRSYDQESPLFEGYYEEVLAALEAREQDD